MINKEEVEQYLKTGGDYCPFCKSPEVQESSILFYDEDTSKVYREMECLTCFEDWTEVFCKADLLPAKTKDIEV